MTVPSQHLAKTPAAYVSYSWGDDSSPEARERESIVDDLCRSFAEVGIVIGRDKNEVKRGDSIEAFGRRIASAPLILAMISRKSLRSEWCMLYELFAAYGRHGGDGKEFSSVVVALVLDDANADMRDRRDLIQYWKSECKRLEEELEEADPGIEKSLDSREVLIRCREMIKSLPDMLLALNKIAMPRGSAAIRRDNFRNIRDYVVDSLRSRGLIGELPDPDSGIDPSSVVARLNHLAHAFPTLAGSSVEGCFRMAIQATWPTQTLESRFPNLAGSSRIDWDDLRSHFGESSSLRHLDGEKLTMLLGLFEIQLKQLTDVKASVPDEERRPILAVLVERHGEVQQDGQIVPYVCKGVLQIPGEDDGFSYELVDPARDHIFCFGSGRSNPGWEDPGIVIGRLWRAALTKLMEIGMAGVEPLLDLYLPRRLFDEDWSSVEVPDGQGDVDSLSTKFYRLRSIDRWKMEDFYKQYFQDKHASLKQGRGRWMLIEAAADPSSIHRDLPLTRNDSETVAILRLGSIGSDMPQRIKWYKAALASSAPVVIWWHHAAVAQAKMSPQKQLTQVLKHLQLVKPSRGQNCHQPVKVDLLALAEHKADLPGSIVILLEDRLEMDPQRLSQPRLFTIVEEKIPSLGYSTG